MLDQRKVGERIAILRKEQKMTQEDLAEKLDITGQAVSKWENGNAMPELSLFSKLTELLNCSADDLLFEKKKESRDRIILPNAPSAKRILEQCKIKDIKKVDLSTVTVSQTDIGRMFVSTDNGIFTYEPNTGELIISKNGVWAQSEKEYELPIKISVLAKTDNTNIRLCFGGWSLIFNWECKKTELRVSDPVMSTTFGISDFGKVPENEFVRIEWLIHRDKSELFVEGKRIYSFEYKNPPEYAFRSKIGVCSAYNSTLTVKSIEVTQNNTIEVLDISKMTLLESQYYMENNELIIFSTDDRYAVSTAESFTLPLKIDLCAKIAHNNMRLYYRGGQVVFNWECDRNYIIYNDITGRWFDPYPYGGFIEPNVYHDVSWILHRDFTAVIVDGAVRFYSEDYPYMRVLQNETINDTIRLASCFGGTMTVKKLDISELK